MGMHGGYLKHIILRHKKEEKKKTYKNVFKKKFYFKQHSFGFMCLFQTLQSAIIVLMDFIFIQVSTVG